METQMMIDKRAENAHLEFKKLYGKYYKALVIRAFQFVSDRAVAEDIVQEVFASMWERDVDIKSASATHIYLYNGVRNRSFNYLEHQQVERSYIQKKMLEIPEYDINGSDEELRITEAIFDRIFTYIDQLPEKQRQVIRLMLEGKKFGEIVQELQLSASTVKTHRKRAMTFLKSKMTAKEYLLFLQFFI